ncbi:MAG TPA: P1 family peptidase [Blastocatellia bacterium]|nr:P1 family peptidase [Blastocatellia bacterium]
MASLFSKGSITQVPGIKVGHAQDTAARTGCTVIMCGTEGAVAGVDVRGAAPGTRETDLLDPGNLVDRVHAIVLTGGSVFGLDSACGVVRFLEERGVGYETGVARVPIVPAAVIFDLAVGDASIRPDSNMGYQACQRASETAGEGRVGVGTGATVGKILGLDHASPGGIGTASTRVRGGATIGVLVVVNAFGDIVDPESGAIVAGARNPAGPGWLNTSRELTAADITATDAEPFSGIQNTTLAVVATDALLNKAQAKRVASMAHDGLARAVRPVHTMFDGDTVFVLSTGNVKADITTIGTAAAETLAKAIVRAALVSSAM